MKIEKYVVRLIVAAAVAGFAAFGCSHPGKEKRDVLFQASTLNALLEGVYDGDVTYGELKAHGDFGLGTFNALDGEMVELDGDVFQVRADGVAYPVEDSMKTPFAVVTFFDADRTSLLGGPMDYKGLKAYLDERLPSKNIFYAIKITGEFDYVKTRSVPRQKKPYPRLVDVVKHQPEFEFHEARGTLVGFRLPEYLKGVNVPGYHLHFLTQDEKAGGHLLECRVKSATVEVDYSTRIYLVLPRDAGFFEKELKGSGKAEVERVER